MDEVPYGAIVLKYELKHTVYQRPNSQWGELTVF